jgi:hypothetical protein
MNEWSCLRTYFTGKESESCSFGRDDPIVRIEVDASPDVFTEVLGGLVLWREVGGFTTCVRTEFSTMF